MAGNLDFPRFLAVRISRFTRNDMGWALREVFTRHPIPRLETMNLLDFRKTNHAAIAGFLMPFLSAGLASFSVLFGKGDYTSYRFLVSFLGIIPLFLAAGIFLSAKSIRLIEEKGDKDYAYSGLVLNLFFTLLYLFSLIYCFLKFNRPQLSFI
jgi:hypothetical protein